MVASAAVDTVYLELSVSGIKTIPIGIIPLEGPPDPRLEEPMHKVLQRDLDQGGRFAPVEFPRYDASGLQRAKAAYFVSGSLKNLSDGNLRLEFRLMASQSGELVVGRAYTVLPLDARRAAHEFSDLVTLQLYGERGCASTHIAWVSKIDGFKQIVVADWDGHDLRQLTNNPSINTMPRWTGDNSALTYTSFRDGFPKVYLRPLGSKVARALFPGHDNSFAASPSPKGEEILFTSNSNQGSDIWKGSISNRKTTRITWQSSAETSPSWSPNGKEILFTSDRSGSPQIYVAADNGGDARRISFQGAYSEQAVWSPRGDRIAFVAMDGGSLNIFTCDPSGHDIVQLTSGNGNNESPSWSPDGMQIVFSSNREGSHQIYVMRKDGSGLMRISRTGDNTLPSWSYFDPQPTQGDSQ